MTTTDNREEIIPRDPSRFMAEPVSPGEVLVSEFMKPAGINQNHLATAIGVPPIRVSEIVRGLRAISADSAMRFATYFGTSPELWLDLQSRWELVKLVASSGDQYADIVPLAETRR